jgi:hypothetical protein
MIWVTDAKHLGAFRIRARFSDGTEGEVDLGDLVRNDARPIVAALRNPTVLAALRVDMDTIVWDNGFDLAPEYLYARAKAVAAA